MSNVKVSKGKEGMAALSKSYLILYNSVQTAGWGYLLLKTLKYLLQNHSSVGLWEECGSSCTVFQSLAVLEIMHCATGLVPSSTLTTFIQVFSRVFMVWGILRQVEEAQQSPTVAITLIAWGITEVVRYSYYLTSLLGASPKPLTWCRYSFFLGLYPAGVIGEIGNVLYALDKIKREKLFYLTLPNKYNISFNFYYFCILLVISYAPVFPQLFGHMLRQRKKILGKSATSGKDMNKFE